MKPISEAFKPFGPGWWKSTGEAVILNTKEQGEKGIGANGKFKPYSASYAERKAAGKFRRQSSQQVSPPNLELTGDLWRDLKTISFEANSVTIGFPTQGARAQFQDEQGRAIFGKDGPSTAGKRLIDRLVRDKMREELKMTRGVKVIRVGK